MLKDRFSLNSWRNFFNIFRGVVWLLPESERPRFFIIFCISAVAGTIESFTYVLIVPFVGSLLNPQKIIDFLAENGIDIVISSSDLFLLFAVILIFVLVFNLSLGLFLQLLIKDFRVLNQEALARKTFNKILGLGYEYVIRKDPNKLAHYLFQDVLGWSSSGLNVIPAITINIFLVVCMLGFLVASWGLAAIWGCLFVLVVYLLISAIIFPLISKYSVAQRLHGVEAQSIAVEMMLGFKSILVTEKPSKFVDIYVEALNKYARSMSNLKILQLITPNLYLALGQVCLIVLAVTLFFYDQNAEFLAEKLMLLVVVVSRIIPAINKLLGDLGALWSLRPGLENLMMIHEHSSFSSNNEVLGLGESGTTDGIDKWSELRFKNVEFQYRGSNRPAIRVPDLCIQRGQKIGIVGESGSGKTTLVDLIGGLLRPSKGSIGFVGKEGEFFSGVSRGCNTVAYVPQDPIVFSMSIGDNLTLGLGDVEVDADKAYWCLKSVGLESFVKINGGLSRCIGGGGLGLSGGQKQRLVIARALYQGATIMLLDEATSALDPLNEKVVFELLELLEGLVTIVMITHRLETLSNVDRVIVLRDGEIVEDGNLTSLDRTGTEFKRLKGFEIEE